MNNVEAKTMKKIDAIVTAGIAAGKNITQEETIEKYLNAIKQYGEEKAIIALDNTLKRFKEEAKEREKRNWSLVRRELLNKGNAVPTSTKNLKDEIKNGTYNLLELSSISQNWIYEQLKIKAS